MKQLKNLSGDTRKMQQRLFVPQRLAGLNDLIGAINRNRFLGNQLKQQETNLIALYAKRLKPCTNPVFIDFKYYEPNAKRDPDNIVAAKKFILDGLVVAGVLPNDTQKWILGFSDTWQVSKKVGVEITIKEI